MGRTACAERQCLYKDALYFTHMRIYQIFDHIFRLRLITVIPNSSSNGQPMFGERKEVILSAPTKYITSTA